jgi:hypothetical protein
MLVLGGVGGALVARARGATPALRDARAWRSALVAQRGEVQAALLMAGIERHHRELYAQRPRFAQPALQWHLEEYILPGLALYRALRETEPSMEAALELTDKLFRAAPSWRSGGVRLLKYLPDPFRIFQIVGRQTLRRSFPAEGWEIRDIVDTRDRLSFTIHRCFYLDVLRSYGAPELTAIFCNRDDTLNAQLPAAIRWERHGTLGRGDALCDFSWRRTVPEDNIISLETA